jgi:hypothetical protein
MISITEAADKLIAESNNLPVEIEDPTAKDQCMDLAFKYLDILGIDRAAIRHQYAYQVWTQPNALTRKFFDAFPNTPDFIPQYGDLAVFKQLQGIPVGHICMVAKGSNIKDMVSFDQNWDTQHYHHVDTQGNWIPYCRTVVHYNYYGVAGFLRPKQLPAGDDVIVNKIQAIVNGSQTPHDKIAAIRQLLA